MRILVTGGAGYIGSHTCLQLLRAGHRVKVVDNLGTSSHEAIPRVERLAGRDLEFTRCDIRDIEKLDVIFAEFRPGAVIHFAGLKAVGESFYKPVLYYDVNVSGTIALLNAMDRAGCDSIVFSSSATVYGTPEYLPCDEDHPVVPINPYGRTKLTCENLINDWSRVKEGRRAVALRYFNPVGADPSGSIGEDPTGDPNNLMPVICQVAVGSRECLQIFGNDYNTIDGTGMRDYVHVVDLALAHLAAVERLRLLDPFEVINIGTGNSISVLQLVKEFERHSGKIINFQICPRRPGDASAIWADASKAAMKLGFRANLGVAEMCQDSWRWQSSNPYGY